VKTKGRLFANTELEIEIGSHTGLDSVDVPPQCMPQTACLTSFVFRKAELQHSVALISHPGAFILLFPAVSALCIHLHWRHCGDCIGWKL